MSKTKKRFANWSCIISVKQGYQAIPAETGEEGLRLIRSEKPDLIVLDLMLPGVDGLEVCRTLKRDPATEAIPLVMLTAKGEESDIVTGLELGADDYLTKPFSPRVLTARIRAVLRRKSEEPLDERRGIADSRSDDSSRPA